ncbi:hypothetical protein FI667_g4138, partial [Globisporangium splendens]
MAEKSSKPEQRDDARIHQAGDETRNDANSASVEQIAAHSMNALRQLWLELGVPVGDQEREEDALARDVKHLYERKTQFYRDEYELSTARIEALQREIAHIRWLFRNDEPHDFGEAEAATTRDKLASLQVKRDYLDKSLQDEFSRLLRKIGEFPEEHQDADQEENLSEQKIKHYRTHIAHLRPLVKLISSRATAEKVSARLKELQAAVDESKQLTKAAAKRESILQERLAYDMSMSDPMRLTTRTGEAGRLLREEKLRNKIFKELPKLTQFLEERIPAWEQQYAVTFFWKGRPYLEYMRAPNREYDERDTLAKSEKESMKQPPDASKPANKHQLIRSAFERVTRDRKETPRHIQVVLLFRRGSLASEPAPPRVINGRRRRKSVESQKPNAELQSPMEIMRDLLLSST